MVAIVRQQKGQGTLEAVLIIATLVFLSGLVANKFKENELLAQLVSGPWQRIAGMLQNGVWIAPAKGMALHPNNASRHISLKGDEPK